MVLRLKHIDLRLLSMTLERNIQTDMWQEMAQIIHRSSDIGANC